MLQNSDQFTHYATLTCNAGACLLPDCDGVPAVVSQQPAGPDLDRARTLLKELPGRRPDPARAS